MKNKKGMLDDMFDLLFTVFMAFFLFLFLNIYIEGGEEDRADQALDLTERINLADNFLFTKRSAFYRGEAIDLAPIENTLLSVRNLGCVCTITAGISYPQLCLQPPECASFGIRDDGGIYCVNSCRDDIPPIGARIMY